MKMYGKREKGITLIALVITIIVLLILAGIAIAALSGENGILTRASSAKIKTTHAAVLESLQIENQNYIAEEKLGTTEQKTLIEYLQGRGIIDENNVVNVTNLLGTKQALGNGTLESGDVYVLEKEETSVSKLAATKAVKVSATSEEEKYKIIYYEKGNANNEEIGYLIDTGKSVADDNIHFTINGIIYSVKDSLLEADAEDYDHPSRSIVLCDFENGHFSSPYSTLFRSVYWVNADGEQSGVNDVNGNTMEIFWIYDGAEYTVYTDDGTLIDLGQLVNVNGTPVK